MCLYRAGPRQAALSDWIKQRLLEMPERFTLITPLPFVQSSALVSLQIKGVTGQQIGEFAGKALQDGRAFLRPVPEFDALRLSAAYYTIEDDFERTFTLLEELATPTPPRAGAS